MVPKGKHIEVFNARGGVILSKISKIINTTECLKNSTICIYDMEHDYFLCCNDGFKKIIGENYTELPKDGWRFWYSLIDPKEVLSIKNKIVNFFSIPYVSQLLNLRYHITDFAKKRIFIKHEILLYKLENHLYAINYFSDISDKEKIEKCFDNYEDLGEYIIPDENSYTISSREKEVLKLIGEGYSSKQIADMLYISNHTAISHRKNLIEKFNVKNTAQLIKRASLVYEL